MSSLKLSSTTPISKDESKKLSNILQSLLNNNDSLEFRNPVDWKNLGLLDYGTLIKNPMDLGTINANFTGNNYVFVQDMLDDIQLVWDNCKTYNPDTTWIHKLAEKLERSFKKMVKNYLPGISITVPGRSGSNSIAPRDEKKVSMLSICEEDQVEIPYSEKQKFSERLKNLNAHSLGFVVEAIMEKCPGAFRETGQDNAEIIVDNMDCNILKQINEIIDEVECGDQVGKKFKQE